MKKKKAAKKLAIVKKPAPPKVSAEAKAMLGQRVQAFTASLQAEAATKFGISADDITVTVHIQIKGMTST